MALTATEKKEIETASANSKVKVLHTVKSGDALGRIAQHYHVSLHDIRAWNHIKGNTIHPGQKLTIYKNSNYFKTTAPEKATHTKTASVTKPVAPKPVAPKVYTVKSGDSLWSISSKHGLSVSQLKALNGLKNDELRPGQKLKLG